MEQTIIEIFSWEIIYLNENNFSKIKMEMEKVVNYLTALERKLFNKLNLFTFISGARSDAPTEFVRSPIPRVILEGAVPKILRFARE